MKERTGYLMFYKNDWFSWSYNGIKAASRPDLQADFKFNINPTITLPLKSFKEELLENTRLIRDKFVEPFDLMLSGGGDSELVLRCHHELKIPMNVFTFRYENDYNLPDVRNAIKICDDLGIKLNIIDFNVTKFFENDADALWNKTFTKRPGRLVIMKLTEYLDNIPVTGDIAPYWKFQDNKWQFEIFEDMFSQTNFAVATGRTIITDWFQHSSEVLLTFMQHPRMRALIDSNKEINSTVFHKTKYYIYNDLWRQILPRLKRNGFEGDNLIPEQCGIPIMTEYYKKITDPNEEFTYYDRQELTRLLVRDYI